jgi:hypothetical protein
MALLLDVLVKGTASLGKYTFCETPERGLECTETSHDLEAETRDPRHGSPDESVR